MTYRPMHEIDPYEDYDFLRRVIMAGYYRDSYGTEPKVGEAFLGDPDGRGTRWIWESGSEVINPLGFMELPNFPIASKNNKYVCGHEVVDEGKDDA